jgi:hypothetical protein
VETIRVFGPTMLRIARIYVRSDEVAEEVVQEVWISVPRARAAATSISQSTSVLEPGALPGALSLGRDLVAKSPPVAST